MFSGAGSPWQSLVSAKQGPKSAASWSSLAAPPHLQVWNPRLAHPQAPAEVLHSKFATAGKGHSSSALSAERSSFLIGTRYSTPAAAEEAGAAEGDSSGMAMPLSGLGALQGAGGLLHGAAGALRGAVSVQPYSLRLSGQTEKPTGGASAQQLASLGSGQLYSSPVATALSDSPWTSPSFKSAGEPVQLIALCACRYAVQICTPGCCLKGVNNLCKLLLAGLHVDSALLPKVQAKQWSCCTQALHVMGRFSQDT